MARRSGEGVHCKLSPPTRGDLQKGFALDIQLRQERTESAPFLDGEEQRCTDHSHRSLVCHTYICLPQTGRARKMREYLINEGEDALAGALFQMGLCDQWRDLQENYPPQTAMAKQNLRRNLFEKRINLRFMGDSYSAVISRNHRLTREIQSNIGGQRPFHQRNHFFHKIHHIVVL